MDSIHYSKWTKSMTPKTVVQFQNTLTVEMDDFICGDPNKLRFIILMGSQNDAPVASKIPY